MSEHNPTAGVSRPVSPLELLIGLVFAFAVSQLSHHLLEHLAWRGAGETLGLLLAVFTVWSFRSGAATVIPEGRSGARWMLLAVMLPGLSTNAALTDAFEDTPWAFVMPMLVIQIRRTVWTIFASADPVYRSHYLRVLAWLATVTPASRVSGSYRENRRVRRAPAGVAGVLTLDLRLLARALKSAPGPLAQVLKSALRPLVQVALLRSRTCGAGAAASAKTIS